MKWNKIDERWSLSSHFVSFQKWKDKLKLEFQLAVQIFMYRKKPERKRRAPNLTLSKFMLKCRFYETSNIWKIFRIVCMCGKSTFTWLTLNICSVERRAPCEGKSLFTLCNLSTEIWQAVKNPLVWSRLQNFSLFWLPREGSLLTAVPACAQLLLAGLRFCNLTDEKMPKKLIQYNELLFLISCHCIYV